MAVAIPFIILGISVLGAAQAKKSSDKQAKSAKEAGKAEQAYASWQASQLRERANNVRASSQRQAIDQRKQAGLAISRAQALAAGSGGGASDPTVTNILGNLAGEGEYNALSSLYEGETEARGLEDQADFTESSGIASASAGADTASALRQSGTLTAIGTIGQAAGSFYGKYGSGSTPTINSGAGLGVGTDSTNGLY